MNFVNSILLIISIIYGSLTMLAGILQLKQRKIKAWASLLMLAGGLLVVISTAHNLFLAEYIAITGLVLIHIAAISNGIKLYGRINISHHMVRLFISLSVVVLFVLK